jgi:hypothetical protein
MLGVICFVLIVHVHPSHLIKSTRGESDITEPHFVFGYLKAFDFIKSDYRHVNSYKMYLSVGYYHQKNEEENFLRSFISVKGYIIFR